MASRAPGMMRALYTMPLCALHRTALHLGCAHSKCPLLPPRAPLPPQKVDQYAFAMTALEICTGDVPWKDPPPAVMKKVIDGVRPNIPPTTHPALTEVIRNCWEHDPKNRPVFDEIVAKLQAIN